MKYVVEFLIGLLYIIGVFIFLLSGLFITSIGIEYFLNEHRYSLGVLAEGIPDKNEIYVAVMFLLTGFLTCYTCVKELINIDITLKQKTK